MCIHVYVYVCTHTHTHKCTSLSLYIHIHVHIKKTCIYIYIHVCVCVCVCMYVCMYVCMCMCMCMCVYIYIYVYMGALNVPNIPESITRMTVVLDEMVFLRYHASGHRCLRTNTPLGRKTLRKISFQGTASRRCCLNNILLPALAVPQQTNIC